MKYDQRIQTLAGYLLTQLCDTDVEVDEACHEGLGLTNNNDFKYVV